MESTARFGLPLLVAGQGQKEITHNEALLLIDAMVGCAVERQDLTTPPVERTFGQCWLVPTGAQGEWSGRAGAVAIWTVGGWRFLVPPDGALVYVKSERVRLRRLEGAWSMDPLTSAPGAAVSDPAGGSIVDSEARAALVAILQRLRGLGLIAA